MWATPVLQKNPGDPIADGEMLCLGLRGKLGKSSGFGNYSLGGVLTGGGFPVYGIWQRRHAGAKDPRFPRLGNAVPEYVRMRSYAPTNPRTVAQQAQRAKMTAAVAAWKSLTDAEKAAYNTTAAKRNDRGYDLFKSEYLLAH